MKKLSAMIIVAVAVVTLFAFGFFIFYSNSVNNKVRAEKELFQKKKECASLQKEIENHYKTEVYSEDTSAWLDKIFYSKKRNSCLYSLSIRFSELFGSTLTLELYDALTNEKIIRETGCIDEEKCGKSIVKATTDFENQMKDYE